MPSYLTPTHCGAAQGASGLGFTLKALRAYQRPRFACTFTTPAGPCPQPRRVVGAPMPRGHGPEAGLQRWHG